MSLERDSHAQEETGTYVTDPLSNTARAPPCLASLSEVCTLGPKCTQMARWNSVLRCFGSLGGHLGPGLRRMRRSLSVRFRHLPAWTLT